VRRYRGGVAGRAVVAREAILDRETLAVRVNVNAVNVDIARAPRAEHGCALGRPRVGFRARLSSSTQTEPSPFFARATVGWPCHLPPRMWQSLRWPRRSRRGWSIATTSAPVWTARCPGTIPSRYARSSSGPTNLGWPGRRRRRRDGRHICAAAPQRRVTEMAAQVNDGRAFAHPAPRPGWPAPDVVGAGNP